MPLLVRSGLENWETERAPLLDQGRAIKTLASFR